MAFDYSATGPFGDVGKLVKYFNTFGTSGAGVATIVDAILDEFEAGNQQSALSGLRPDAQANWEAEYIGRRAQLREYAIARLQDYATVLDEVGASSDSIDEVLRKLIEQMTTEAQTIERSVATIGTVTAHGDNVGDGTLYVGDLLDGVSSPGSREGVSFPAHHLYVNVSSELAVAETIRVRCTADSYSGGQTEGGESFSIEGDVPDQQFGIRSTEGSGVVGTMQAIHSLTTQYISNPDFESAAVAHTPDNWTIDTGVAATTIKLATAGADVYHGAKSLQFYGNGATANLKISQAIVTQANMGGRGMFLCFRYKGDGTSAGLIVRVTGTGFTYATTISSVLFPAVWTLRKVPFVLPFDLPDDLEIEIQVDGTLANTQSIWVDDLGFAPLTYGAGLAFAAIRGATPFVVNDRFTSAVTVVEGVFQKFFRRCFGVQLPSDPTPSIDDALAS